MLNHNGCVSLYVGQNEMKGVGIALNNLAEDINKVCGAKAVFTDAAKANVVVGTLGHSAIIDKFIKEGKIDARQLRGKRETYIITVVGNQLVIAGYRDWETDRKSTRLNSSHITRSRMPSSA